MAAWFGGELFILRQVRALSDAAKRLAKGDLQPHRPARSGGELGQLAKIFDDMAERCNSAIKEREEAE